MATSRQSPAAQGAIVARPKQVPDTIAYLLRADRKPFLWGPPGIGKSEMVAQAAGRYFVEVMNERGEAYSCDALGRVHGPDGRFVPTGRYLVDVRAVLLDPVDLRGLPTITTRPDGTKVTEWAPPAFLPTVDEPITVFLDELTRAPVMVQNGLLQYALDGKIGEHVKPASVRIVAASNRESDGGGVQRATSALMGRFQHVEVVTDVEDWSAWAVQSGIDPLVIAFLRYRPNLLEHFDKNARAWPNPRAWKFVSDIAKTRPPKEIERILVAGTVGEGAVVEYLSFVEMYRNLPSIDAILLAPDTAAVPTEVGTLYAVASAMAARAKVDNFDRVLAYLDRLPQEFAVFSVRDAVLRDPGLSQTAPFTRWAVAHTDLI